MAYATSTDLNALVQHSVAADTATLLLDQAAQAIDGYVRVPLTEDTYTETFGTSSQEFSPDRTRLWVAAPGWPLDVAEVVEDGVTLTTDDYRADGDGKLVRLDTEGNGDEWGDEVTVTYTTGFAEGTFELATAQRITLELAAESAANPQNMDSFTADGVQVRFRRGHGTLSLAAEHREQLYPLKWRRRWA